MSLGVRRLAAAFGSRPLAADRPPGGKPPLQKRWQATALRNVWLLLFVALADPAFPCTVCMGAPGDPLVEGANAGIWVLLGIIFLVQIGFVALFVAFWRRGREVKRFRESLRVIEGGNT